MTNGICDLTQEPHRWGTGFDRYICADCGAPMQCGHCGHLMTLRECGWASVDAFPLCHRDDHDCYKLVTVYHQPMGWANQSSV